MSNGIPSVGYRADIDGLRAVAVAVVVAYHAAPLHLTGGFVGVDVFFVISGFLITTLLLRERTRSGRVDLAAFWLLNPPPADASTKLFAFPGQSTDFPAWLRANFDRLQWDAAAARWVVPE